MQLSKFGSDMIARMVDEAIRSGLDQVGKMGLVRGQMHGSLHFISVDRSYANLPLEQVKVPDEAVASALFDVYRYFVAIDMLGVSNGNSPLPFPRVEAATWIAHTLSAVGFVPFDEPLPE